MNKNEIVLTKEVSSKIYKIHGKEVMLDRDLATFYGVLTERLNEQVKRNNYRFPKGSYFQLNKQDVLDLRSQNAGANISPKSRVSPYVFDRDAAVLASYVLKSKTAIEKSIFVVKAFNVFNDMLPLLKGLASRVEVLEKNYEIRRVTDETVHYAMNRELINHSGEFSAFFEDNKNIKRDLKEIKDTLDKLIKGKQCQIE